MKSSINVVAGQLLLALLWLATPMISHGQESQQQPPQADTTNQIDQHFKQAHENFIKKDTKAAAAEIREAARLVDREAKSATGEGKKALLDSGKELEKLAGDVEKGTVKSVESLDHAFARVDHDLARHHYLRASASWAKRAAEDTGHELEAAAGALEHGAAWSGREAEKAVRATVRDTRLIAGKLIEGTGWVPAEVGKGIEKVGDGVERLGRWVEPRRKEGVARSATS